MIIVATVIIIIGIFPVIIGARKTLFLTAEKENILFSGGAPCCINFNFQSPFIQILSVSECWHRRRGVLATLAIVLCIGTPTRLCVRAKSPLQLQCSPVGDNSDPCCVSVHCIAVSYVHAHNTGQQKNKDILKSGKDKETQGNFDGTKSSLIFATIEEKA